MNVLVLYTRLAEELRMGRRSEEFDLKDAAEGIARSLPNVEIAGLHGSAREILAILEAKRPDVVFNLCEAPLGRPDLESHVAALFEWQGVRFTGCGSETLSLCRRKDHTKAVLTAAGVAVPRATGFPCIVKPVDEDGSAGIDVDSVCCDAAALKRALARLSSPVLVEEFLPGKEYVVSLWGQIDPDYVSIGELVFEYGLRLFTYAAKWDMESDDFASVHLDYQMEIDALLRDTLTAAARDAWRAVGARGYLRVDVRLDEAGVPHVLDVNPNPEVTPGRGGMYRSVTEAGWTWERFVRQQIEWARP